MFAILMRIAEDLTPAALACIVADVAGQSENGVTVVEETDTFAKICETQLIALVGANDARLMIDEMGRHL